MKAKLRIRMEVFLTCSILVSILTNCSQESKYSCDEEVNQWVKYHLKDLQDITRTELAGYPFNYQVAIFRSLDAYKKSEIWIEKVDSIQLYNWPQNLYPYIDSLKTRIQADFFEAENATSSKAYCSTLLSYILSLQGIDTSQVVCSFYTIMTISEIEQGVYAQQPGPQNCVCNWDITCSILNAGLCEDGLDGCMATDDGCGFLYMYSCEGDCTDMVVKPDEN
ncbi:MAG TPA: bacteriocin fulvocin C-related protein [Bacteroidales bacterium]|nr:bacteriocin fulvocin C-related protein [Bacteroidales bacterium]HPI86165.1 bacteriocin fulvocin C-related protein [Bacteroidales bacterium]HPM93013.1 bacteriocin fulvocin C-related protein [Bacteroidales bacterium]